MELNRRALFAAGTAAAAGALTVSPAAAFAAAYQPAEPAGADWIEILGPKDSPYQISASFYGWHRQATPAMPPAPYPFEMTRSTDWNYDRENPSCFWWYIQRAGRGTFDWSGVDRWVATHRAENPKRKLCYVLFWTPQWASSQPADNAWADKYPGWRGGAWPPSDWAYLREFLRAFKKRYPPAVIPYVEVWNEPTTYSDDSDARNEADLAAFYRGTMRELVHMHKITKDILTDRPILSGGWDSQRAFRNFCRTPTVDGRRGLDVCDWVSFHSYMYKSNPQIAFTTARDMRNIINNYAAEFNRPRWRKIPLINTETGHGVVEATALDEATVVQNMLQVVGFSVAAAVAYDVRGVILYADHESARTFRGPFHTSPALTAAARKCHTVVGKTLRQAQVRLDPAPPHQNPGKPNTVWLRFSDNTEYQA